MVKENERVKEQEIRTQRLHSYEVGVEGWKGGFG